MHERKYLLSFSSALPFNPQSKAHTLTSLSVYIYLCYQMEKSFASLWWFSIKIKTRRILCQASLLLLFFYIYHFWDEKAAHLFVEIISISSEACARLFGLRELPTRERTGASRKYSFESHQSFFHTLCFGFFFLGTNFRSVSTNIVMVVF